MMPGILRPSRVSPLTLIAALSAAAALCAPAWGGEASAPLPPLEVTVESTGPQCDVAVMPVEFLAPLADEDAAKEGQCFLKSADGRAHLCQYELLPKGEGGLGYAWARFSALLPNRNADYVFGRTSELVPGSMPAVSTLIGSAAVVLDSGSLEVTLEPWNCEVVKDASFDGRIAVASLVRGTAQPAAGAARDGDGPHPQGRLCARTARQARQMGAGNGRRGRDDVRLQGRAHVLVGDTADGV